MRRCLTLLMMVGCVTCAAWANSITIGQLQYLGTNPEGISAFKVIVDPTGVTSTQLSLANLTVSLKGISQSTGAITTPITLLFVGGQDHPLPACPCVMVGMELFLSANNKPVTLRLANGELFKTAGSASFTLIPPTGHSVLEPGNSIPVTLTSVPEPATLGLIGTGLIVVAFRRRRIGLGRGQPSRAS